MSGATPNINNAADVKNWAEATLGLGFDAFRASVLLRQGDADAIINAGGTDRLKILKKIIEIDRFEMLSDRVHAEAVQRKNRLTTLQDRRNHLWDNRYGTLTLRNDRGRFIDDESWGGRHSHHGDKHHNNHHQGGKHHHGDRNHHTSRH